LDQISVIYADHPSKWNYIDDILRKTTESSLGAQTRNMIILEIGFIRQMYLLLGIQQPTMVYQATIDVYFHGSLVKVNRVRKYICNVFVQIFKFV
jgi:hypothetical protein